MTGARSPRSQLAAEKEARALVRSQLKELEAKEKVLGNTQDLVTREAAYEAKKMAEDVQEGKEISAERHEASKRRAARQRDLEQQIGVIQRSISQLKLRNPDVARSPTPPSVEEEAVAAEVEAHAAALHAAARAAASESPTEEDKASEARAQKGSATLSADDFQAFAAQLRAAGREAGGLALFQPVREEEPPVQAREDGEPIVEAAVMKGAFHLIEDHFVVNPSDAAVVDPDAKEMEDSEFVEREARLRRWENLSPSNEQFLLQFLWQVYGSVAPAFLLMHMNGTALELPESKHELALAFVKPAGGKLFGDVLEFLWGTEFTYLLYHLDSANRCSSENQGPLTRILLGLLNKTIQKFLSLGLVYSAGFFIAEGLSHIDNPQTMLDPHLARFLVGGVGIGVAEAVEYKAFNVLPFGGGVLSEPRLNLLQRLGQSVVGRGFNAMTAAYFLMPTCPVLGMLAGDVILQGGMQLAFYKHPIGSLLGTPVGLLYDEDAELDKLEVCEGMQQGSSWCQRFSALTYTAFIWGMRLGAMAASFYTSEMMEWCGGTGFRGFNTFSYDERSGWDIVFLSGFMWGAQSIILELDRQSRYTPNLFRMRLFGHRDPAYQAVAGDEAEADAADALESQRRASPSLGNSINE